MVFKSAIPQPGDFLNTQSQPDLLGNMATLDAVFGVDHFPFSNSTAQMGYHTLIHQPFSVGDPEAIMKVGQLYTKQAPTQTELFYENDVGVVTQLTSSGGAGAASAIRAWGLVNSSALVAGQSINVASVVNNSVGMFTVNLSITLPSTNYGVLMSYSSALGNTLAGVYNVVSQTQFTMRIKTIGGALENPGSLVFQLIQN